MLADAKLKTPTTGLYYKVNDRIGYCFVKYSAQMRGSLFYRYYGAS